MKHTPLTDELAAYMDRCRTHFDEQVLQDLRRETQRFSDDAIMEIGNDLGGLLTILTKLISARRAIEIGTFTGHSSICIARGLTSDGQLFCFDTSQEWTAVARKYWARAGLDHKITLTIGNAVDHVETIAGEGPFDLAFIDADKSLYGEYFNCVLPLVRSGGLMLFDNMFRGGRVLDATVDAGTAAIRDLNRVLCEDSRVETVLVSIGDGIQVTRKI